MRSPGVVIWPPGHPLSVILVAQMLFAGKQPQPFRLGRRAQATGRLPEAGGSKRGCGRGGRRGTQLPSSGRSEPIVGHHRGPAGSSRRRTMPQLVAPGSKRRSRRDAPVCAGASLWATAPWVLTPGPTRGGRSRNRCPANADLDRAQDRPTAGQ